MVDNPWVRKSPGAEPAPVIVEAPAETGPKPASVTTPQDGVPVPDQADRLPQRKTPHGSTIWWLGVTGGAGDIGRAIALRLGQDHDLVVIADLDLVLIPDMPGRMPKELRHLAQVVSGGLPHTWSLPWVDAWRFGPLDPAADLPKEFHALLADLHLNSTAP